ncbi:MAG: hypothetical protein LUC39_00390 [Clostridiales bacterium]|nr:hypothetical protein [Clostridiales bacterium]
MENKRYNELFPDTETKAKAFDKIAGKFYDSNFGQMSKSDLEVLLFGLYIDRILEQGEYNFRAYSDYKLSKELGIPESRIRTLKVKKQLQYPRELCWVESLANVSKNAQYENGKIKIQIPDINHFNEIKNAVEEMGGYIDISLTPKLLQISPGYFLDLLVMAEAEENRDTLRKELREKIRLGNKDQEYLETESFGKLAEKFSRDVAVNTISDVLSSLIEGKSNSWHLYSLVCNILQGLQSAVSKEDNDN